jgi:hypothetical protein
MTTSTSTTITLAELSTTTTSTVTTTTMCMSTGKEICNDGIDNDCNGLIDCADPACQPAVCFGGTADDKPCVTQSDQMICVQGGGVCQCPSIEKDPTSIKFGPVGSAHDTFRSHGRVLLPGQSLAIQSSPVSWLLSDSRGKIFEIGLPAGGLTPNANGTSFKYKNLLAKTAGGLYQVKLSFVHGTLNTVRYSVEAFGDLSRATDPNMSLQFYVANQPTPAIHTQVWEQTRAGWLARQQ